MVGKGRGGGGVVGFNKGYNIFISVFCCCCLFDAHAHAHILHTKHTKEAKLMLRVNV